MGSNLGIQMGADDDFDLTKHLEKMSKEFDMEDHSNSERDREDQQSEQNDLLNENENMMERSSEELNEEDVSPSHISNLSQMSDIEEIKRVYSRNKTKIKDIQIA